MLQVYNVFIAYIGIYISDFVLHSISYQIET